MDIIGKNLKRVRLLRNLSLKDAGDLLHMSAPAIAKYEKGLIIPNSQKLIEFANAYNVNSFDFLKSYDVPNMKFDAFRKKQRLTGKNLELLKEIIQNEVANYLEVIEMNEINQIKKIKQYNCDSFEDAEKIAYQFREYYDLSKYQPLFNLINILENIGIIIIQIENINNKFKDFDGLSEVVNNIPIIVLLKDDNGARQRFTIAHELGHLVLNFSNKNIDIEKMCNRFASALLMPKESIINEFGEKRKKLSFYELKAFALEYRVSMAATLYRLKDLDIISEDTYRNINVFLGKNNFRKKEPIDIEVEYSYQLKKLVHKLESNNIISLNKACEFLGISENEYIKENNNYRY